MEHKTPLERHIDSMKQKQLISFGDLVKLNNFSNTKNELNVGSYITFQYNHKDNKNVFNKVPFILVTNYSPYHVSGINLLHLNIPLRARLFDVVGKSTNLKHLHHELHTLSSTHYMPYFQSFSFKNFGSHIMSFDKEHHELLAKLPLVPVNNSIDIKHKQPDVIKPNKYVVQPKFIKQV